MCRVPRIEACICNSFELFPNVGFIKTEICAFAENFLHFTEK